MVYTSVITHREAISLALLLARKKKKITPSEQAINFFLEISWSNILGIGTRILGGTLAAVP